MIYKKLAEIQQTLKAPKGQVNKFGNYRYRSCEDILEAVKPLLGDCALTLSDEMVEVGGRVYVKATATLTDGKDSATNTAFAREAEMKKGMDDSQITGATSSYARKYALNGLFAIDDTNDADTQDNTEINDPDAQLSMYKLQRIKALAETTGRTEKLASVIKERFNKDKLEDLTMREADAIIQGLSNIKNGATKDVSK